MVNLPTPEAFAALRRALAEATQRSEALAAKLQTATGELRMTHTERDLLKEQLNQFKRQLFAAKSEVLGAHQKELFFNEAELEGATAQPAGEEAEGGRVEVPAHSRRNCRCRVAPYAVAATG